MVLLAISAITFLALTPVEVAKFFILSEKSLIWGCVIPKPFERVATNLPASSAPIPANLEITAVVFTKSAFILRKLPMWVTRADAASADSPILIPKA